MKKIIDFLSAPVVNLIIGLILYFWIGCSMWQYDSFDRFSAFYGGLFVIAIDIFGYGFNALVDQFRSKRTTRQDPDDSN